MSSLDSIFTSNLSEKRWSEQISKNFDKDKEIAIDIRDVVVSVFNVPKAISAFKPEAYVPQAIALGPYHHFKPELYQMERYKVAAVQSFLKDHKVLNFQTVLIERLKQIEPTIRACYHKYLDFDDGTLAWLLAIDGLFLLDLLSTCSDDSVSETLTQNSILCRDILILENQFPMIILKEIRKTLQLVVVEENDYVDDELNKMLIDFCVAHSPLPIAVKSEFPPGTKMKPLHLLDLMYFLILNTRTSKASPQESPSKNSEKKTDVTNEVETSKQDLILTVGEIFDVTLELGIGGEAMMPLQVIKNLPWEKLYNILGLKNSNKVVQTNALLVAEILIPTVTHLYNVGGVKFKPTGGIKDVKFDENESTLYLPVLTINNITEAVLRNLLAYEAATSNSKFELAQYVDLMSGIIDSAEDVKILIDNGIIKSEVSAEIIADLFNGMNKSMEKVGNVTMEKINEYFSKKPKVKIYRFWKKKIYESWKFLTVLSTILLLLLLVLQSFCEVYGCPRIFWKN